MNLKGSQTESNLARAYASECQARTRYEFIEYGARYNGYKNIADIIDEIIYQEFNHARMFYTFIQNGNKDEMVDNIDICAGFPFREKWDLMENLRLASEDEANEEEIYADFAQIARDEGFFDIAKLFEDVKKVENYHKQIFTELYEQFKDGTLYKKDKEVMWICNDCGYMEVGKEAWQECPLCNAKRESIKLILEAKLLNTKYSI
ncbi:MAG: rubrerythrin family protein [Christensenellales bacterium]